MVSAKTTTFARCDCTGRAIGNVSNSAGRLEVQRRVVAAEEHQGEWKEGPPSSSTSWRARG